MKVWLRANWDKLIEPVFALAIAVALTVAIFNLLTQGYLPQPFFYEPNDTWMDWFNSSAWGRDPGVYDTWGTIYPPLTFVILDMLGDPRCYPGALGFSSRACDWMGIVVLHFWFVLNMFLICRTFLKVDRRTAVWRSFALATGFPMLDALERGNIVIITFTCYLLAYGPLLRSARWRWFFAAMCMNFKVYLIAPIACQLIRRRWLWFEGAVLMTIVIYLVTWGLLGVGTPMEIYTNIIDYTETFQVGTILDVWYATTYKPVIGLLTGWFFPVVDILGSDRTETSAVLIQVALHSTQGIILLAVAAIWLRPEAVPQYRIVNLATTFALISSEAGGYSQTFLILLTFLEPWKGVGRRIALVLCYILCIPADILIHPLNPGVRPGWYDGPPVFYAYWMTVGPFVRPGLIMIIAVCLSVVSMREVQLDIWQQRWRDRWRYRRDLPLFMGGGDFHRPASVSQGAA